MLKQFLVQKYINPHLVDSCRGWFHFLLWQIGYYRDPAPLPPIPPHFSYPNEEDALKQDCPTVTWINHSTFLISVAGKHFLLDPIWNQRCSPVPFFGPKRNHPPGLAFEKLPNIDYVIISHNHYDHLDKNTVLRIKKTFQKVIWIVPKGVKSWFNKHTDSTSVYELEWGEILEFQDVGKQESVRFTAVEAQHFSGRGLWDRNTTLWMGCIVDIKQSQELYKRFYFAGDTGYNPYDFKSIGARFAPIDLSIIPIGIYTPRKFMQPVHIQPQESVVIHKEVGSRLSVGSHFGTFRLGQESLRQPPYDLYQALKDSGISWKEFRVLNPGQTICW